MSAVRQRGVVGVDAGDAAHGAIFTDEAHGQTPADLIALLCLEGLGLPTTESRGRHRSPLRDEPLLVEGVRSVAWRTNARFLLDRHGAVRRV
jgi:hypothetical protein